VNAGGLEIGPSETGVEGRIVGDAGSAVMTLQNSPQPLREVGPVPSGDGAERPLDHLDLRRGSIERLVAEHVQSGRELRDDRVRAVADHDVEEGGAIADEEPARVVVGTDNPPFEDCDRCLGMSVFGEKKRKLAA
jgi:hypothetical protein